MAFSHGESHLQHVAMGLSPASLRVSDAVSHGSGRSQHGFTYEAWSPSELCQELTCTIT